MQTRAALLAAMMLSAAPAHAQTTAPRAQVMILGTYHMNNPGEDYANPTADDVLAPHRQAEIVQVVQALAEFRPTRIAIEAEPHRDSIFNARYAQYRAGTHVLTRDERQQLGFRLAAMLGHERVYLVDYQLEMDVEAVLNYAVENGQGELAQRMGASMQAMAAEMNARMATQSVGAILAEDNSVRMDSTHGWYLTLATVGRDSTYIGAREVGNWYVRNLYIFANIARVAQPGERVLVIMGSGHGALLRQFLGESPDLELVPVQPYLDRFVTPDASP